MKKYDITISTSQAFKTRDRGQYGTRGIGQS
jgi:hypothetical protein